MNPRPAAAAGVALATSRVALRDRPFVDVLDLSFRFMRDAFGPLAKLALCVLPLPILATIGLGLGAGWGWAWSFAAMASPLVAAPFTVLVGQFVFEQDPSVRSALSRGVRAIPKLLLVYFILGITMGGGLLFFVLPAFWIATVALFVTEAVVLERASIVSAFDRSMKLASRAPGDTTLGRIVTLTLLLVAPMLADQIGHIALGSLFQVSGPQPLWDAGGNWLATLGFWLIVPYATVLRFLLYINVRTRTEGWDIQTAFATLALESKGEGDSSSNGRTGVAA